MPNTNFNFIPLTNFTVTSSFGALADELQAVQIHADDALKARDIARIEYQQWQEYLDLVSDYRDLFSSMMKKLMDARTGTDIQKIRAYYANKLTPILQKLDAIRLKLRGLTPAEQVKLEASINEKLANVTQLFDQAIKLQKDLQEPELLAPR